MVLGGDFTKIVPQKIRAARLAFVCSTTTPMLRGLAESRLPTNLTAEDRAEIPKRYAP